jgi:hypothetical protein
MLMIAAESPVFHNVSLLAVRASGLQIKTGDNGITVLLLGQEKINVIAEFVDVHSHCSCREALDEFDCDESGVVSRLTLRG